MFLKREKILISTKGDIWIGQILISGKFQILTRRLLTALIVLAVSLICLPEKEALCADDYSNLLAKVKDFDQTVDFKALRLSYTKTDNYKPYGADDSEKDAMFKALNEKRYEDAIKSAQSIMDKNYVDIDAHFVSRIAYRELGNQKKFEFHRFVSKGLIDSILNSGTGQTHEGALLIISTREEYVILEVLGLVSKSQQTVEVSGQTYDKLEVADRKTGDTGGIFFNVSIPFGWLNRELKK